MAGEASGGARRILAATDFSEIGLAGVRCAFALAGRDASVMLLHVIERHAEPNPLYAHYTPGRAPTEEQSARQHAELRARLEALAPDDARARGVRCQAWVEEGPEASDAICAAAERFDADLVVLGSHGRTGVARVLLGSVAEQVLRHTRRSVVVIRPAHA